MAFAQLLFQDHGESYATMWQVNGAETDRQTMSLVSLPLGTFGPDSPTIGIR